MTYQTLQRCIELFRHRIVVMEDDELTTLAFPYSPSFSSAQPYADKFSPVDEQVI